MDKAIPFMDQVVNTIVSTVNPEKIILFGSYARGDYEKDSDIDLLVLKKGLKNEREVANNLYLKFFNQKISVPIDIIAVDYDKYYQLNDDVGYIYKTIKREGKVVYE